MQASIIGGAPATLLALVSIGVQRKQASQTRENDARQAEVARQHELRLHRMPDLRAASTAFARRMRELNDFYLREEAERGVAFPAAPQPPYGDFPAREEPTAERLLQELELVADDDVMAAARTYLEEHFEVWWGPYSSDLRRPTDLPGARERFIEAVKTSLYGT